MQARQMLIDNEIHASDWRQAARMTALVAQAQGTKFIPELLSASGQRIIADFGEVIRQKFERVKNKSSDNGHYMMKRNSVDEMKVDSGCDKEEHSHDSRHLERFIIENYLEHMTFPSCDEDDDNEEEMEVGEESSSCKQVADFLLDIAREHQKIHNMTQASAKYWLLEEFSTLKSFGEETFEGTLISESESKVTQQRNEKIRVAVNSQGLCVGKLESGQKFSIPFSAVESAKSLRRCFHLCYLNDSYTDSSMIIKFSSHRIAGTLYRALTEKHSFYSCETVHKNVETQFIRDLKVRKVISSSSIKLMI
jgi:E3 ubiquitin-protein ligase MYLIP